jgi:hypothetical protein
MESILAKDIYEALHGKTEAEVDQILIFDCKNKHAGKSVKAAGTSYSPNYIMINGKKRKLTMKFPDLTIDQSKEIKVTDPIKSPQAQLTNSADCQKTEDALHALDCITIISKSYVRQMTRDIVTVLDRPSSKLVIGVQMERKEKTPQGAATGKLIPLDVPIVRMRMDIPDDYKLKAEADQREYRKMKGIVDPPEQPSSRPETAVFNMNSPYKDQLTGKLMFAIATVSGEKLGFSNYHRLFTKGSTIRGTLDMSSTCWSNLGISLMLKLRECYVKPCPLASGGDAGAVCSEEEQKELMAMLNAPKVAAPATPAAPSSVTSASSSATSATQPAVPPTVAPAAAITLSAEELANATQA